MLLSICIPTYERTACLYNCLNSIYIAKKKFNFNFEVCISDNCSSEDVGNIIKYYKKNKYKI
jgi:glycosyltransferase involved in cell wall biosynthesis